MPKIDTFERQINAAKSEIGMIYTGNLASLRRSAVVGSMEYDKYFVSIGSLYNFLEGKKYSFSFMTFDDGRVKI